MINARNVRNVLEQTLGEVTLEGFEGALQSATLVSAINGSILSYSMNQRKQDDPSEPDSLNNLKMMSLLCKDKWLEDENDTSEQLTKSCYNYQWNVSDDATVKTRIYIYEIENLHTCIAQIPDSDLLLLFISGDKFPYGLLTMKVKYTLIAFNNLINYKLG